jgi:hypothetical protein
MTLDAQQRERRVTPGKAFAHDPAADYYGQQCVRAGRLGHKAAVRGSLLAYCARCAWAV